LEELELFREDVGTFIRSTTSCPRSSTTRTPPWRSCRSTCATWRRPSATSSSATRSTSPVWSSTTSPTTNKPPPPQHQEERSRWTRPRRSAKVRRTSGRPPGGKPDPATAGQKQHAGTVLGQPRPPAGVHRRRARVHGVLGGPVHPDPEQPRHLQEAPRRADPDYLQGPGGSGIALSVHVTDSVATNARTTGSRGHTGGGTHEVVRGASPFGPWNRLVCRS
jgi:hypothetical protein